MTTKKKTEAPKKSPAKKAVTKVKKVASAAAGKSTVRHRASTRRKNKSESSTPGTHFSQPAFSLIDQAAGFIQKAMSQADQATAFERKALRDNAMSFIDGAGKRLMQALDEGSTPSRKKR